MMQISELNDEQREKLTIAIQQAMVSAAAQILMDKDSRDRMLSYQSHHPDCSAADMIDAGLGNAAESLLKYRPFEFNEFLESLA